MKKNIWRILFWGLILILCLTLGIVGYLENRRINDQAEILLNKIKNILKDSYIITKYEESNVQIDINVKGNKLTITFSDSTEKDYVYSLKDNVLSTQYSKNDTTGREMLVAVTDSIAVLNGESSNQVYTVFQNNSIDNYTFEEGIKITYNLTTTDAILNTNVAVTPHITENKISYFLYEDFSEEEKENYSLTKTKGNLIFIRENETEFALAEINKLSNDAKESLKNIIIYFYGTEYSNKLENVDFENKINYEDEIIKIMFNPEENEYESKTIPKLVENILTPEKGENEANNTKNKYEFIRVTIKK